MRISDWSSDVCSSDLVARQVAGAREDDRPGHGRRPAPQLAVHEIGEAAERLPAAVPQNTSASPGCSRSGRMWSSARRDIVVEQEIGELETPVAQHRFAATQFQRRSEEHKSELQSLMRISYAVFC